MKKKNKKIKEMKVISFKVPTDVYHELRNRNISFGVLFRSFAVELANKKDSFKVVIRDGKCIYEDWNKEPVFIIQKPNTLENIMQR